MTGSRPWRAKTPLPQSCWRLDRPWPGPRYVLMGRYGFKVAAPQMGINGDDMGSPKGNPGTRTDTTKIEGSKECHHANQTELHDTVSGSGRCRGGYRRRTDCHRGTDGRKWSLSGSKWSLSGSKWSRSGSTVLH